MVPLGIPKPVRVPKERKPLRRKSLLKRSSKPIRRMTRDPAAFRQTDIEAVYEGDIRCFQTALPGTFDQPVEAHHILGRQLGRDREAASSILNLAWLRRDIHQGPIRDDRDQRRVYLRIAQRNMLAAWTSWKYGWNDADYAFIRFVRQRCPEFADIYDGLEA